MNCHLLLGGDLRTIRVMIRDHRVMIRVVPCFTNGPSGWVWGRSQNVGPDSFIALGLLPMWSAFFSFFFFFALFHSTTYLPKGFIQFFVLEPFYFIQFFVFEPFTSSNFCTWTFDFIQFFVLEPFISSKILFIFQFSFFYHPFLS
jgi:hypothetical protein